MMKTTHFLFGTLVIAAASCNKVKEPDWNSTDDKFLKMAAYGNHNEIEAGALDTSKATDRSVKEFGRMMIMDHMDAQDELKRIAKDKDEDIPSEADAAHKALMQQMSSMSGRAFDSMYIHSQVKDHKEVISLFQEEISKGKDQDLKDYANKYLPGIQMHLHRADTTANRF
jgi:putative membrane protein